MGRRANRLSEVWQRTGNPDEKGGHALSLQGLPKVLFREDGNADGGIEAPCDQLAHGSLSGPDEPQGRVLNEAATRSEDQAVLGMVHPKFSSWSLIPANLGRCFHAISAR